MVGTNMNESTRRVFDRANDLVNKALKVDAWISNILFLLIFLYFFGYVIYRGWLHYHLQ